MPKHKLRETDIDNDVAEDFIPSADMIDDINPRTLYVGNLDPSISEEFVVSLFGQIGQVTKCKIIHETGNDPYAFVEFAENSAAIQALTAMNKRNLLGRAWFRGKQEMKVNWATHPGHSQRVDTSKHFHIFVGDLSPDIDNKTLRDAFAPFGEISDAKVIRDLQSLKSKGYGFVSFVNKEDAERSIEAMNGQWLGRKTIRTNWATRKPHQSFARGWMTDTLNFDEVYKQSSDQNCTTYVGNAGPNITEQNLRDTFAEFGNILEVRIFRQQGYCFVRFDNKDSACNAICNVHGTEINGTVVRCSWGREDGGRPGAPPGTGGPPVYAPRGPGPGGPNRGGGGHYNNHGGGGDPRGPPGHHGPPQNGPGPGPRGGPPPPPNNNYPPAASMPNVAPNDPYYAAWQQYYAQYYQNPQAYQQQYQQYMQQWQQHYAGMGNQGGQMGGGGPGGGGPGYGYGGQGYGPGPNHSN